VAVIRRRQSAPGLATGPRGFTLVEAVLATVIVAVMLVAVLSTLGGVARARTIQQADQTASVLGWGLLWEVVQARYEDPSSPGGWGKESGEGLTTRLDFDDIDDYDGWSACPPQAKDGATLSEYEGWGRSVAVTCVQSTGLITVPQPGVGLRQIRVTVEDPQGNTTDFYALRCDRGLGQKEPGFDGQVVTWAEVSLQCGTNSARTDKAASAVINAPRAE